MWFEMSIFLNFGFKLSTLQVKKKNVARVREGGEKRAGSILATKGAAPHQLAETPKT